MERKTELSRVIGELAESITEQEDADEIEALLHRLVDIVALSVKRDIFAVAKQLSDLQREE